MLLTEGIVCVFVGQCQTALGMESGAIPDHAITASSSYEEGSVGPESARSVDQFLIQREKSATYIKFLSESVKEIIYKNLKKFQSHLTLSWLLQRICCVKIIYKE